MTKTTAALPPVPAGLLGVAETRRTEALRVLHNKRDRAGKQLNNPSITGAAQDQGQRRQLQQVRDEIEIEISYLSRLSGRELAAKFCESELAELDARAKAGNAPAEFLSHEQVIAARAMADYNRNRQGPAERIVTKHEANPVETLVLPPLTGPE